MIWIFVSAILALALLGLWITLQRGCLSFFYLWHRAEPGQKRVACVGDSITYGYGVRNWVRKQYPARLAKLLDQGYCVRNFGVCGGTASMRGDLPYEKTAAYRKSLDFCPDIVLLLLGTNDSKPYNYQGSEAYQTDLKRLCAAYRALPTKPQIFLLTPPPAWSIGEAPVRFDIRADVIENELYPAVRALSTAEQIPCIDLFSAMHSSPELFGDGVHPNAKGAEAIAGIAYDSLKVEENI